MARIFFGGGLRAELRIKEARVKKMESDAKAKEKASIAKEKAAATKKAAKVMQGTPSGLCNNQLKKHNMN
jgi:hypothetical protein